MTNNYLTCGSCPKYLDDTLWDECYTQGNGQCAVYRMVDSPKGSPRLLGNVSVSDVCMFGLPPDFDFSLLSDRAIVFSVIRSADASRFFGRVEERDILVGGKLA